MAQGKKRAKAKELNPPYVPTELEKTAVSEAKTLAKARAYAPKLKMDWDEDVRTNAIEFDHPDEKTGLWLALREIGSADTRFFGGPIIQIAGLGERVQAEQAKIAP